MAYTRADILADRIDSINLGIRLYDEVPRTKATLSILTDLHNERAKAHHQYAEETGRSYVERLC